MTVQRDQLLWYPGWAQVTELQIPAPTAKTRILPFELLLERCKPLYDIHVDLIKCS